jgi:hypothetical protein
MVSTISLIQANLQHSIAASRFFSRTAAVKGIDMALIHEPWVREGCAMGLNIPCYRARYVSSCSYVTTQF